MSKDLVDINGAKKIVHITKTLIKSKFNLDDDKIIETCRKVNQKMQEQKERIHSQGFRKFFGGLGMFIDGIGDIIEEDKFENMKKVE